MSLNKSTYWLTILIAALFTLSACNDGSYDNQLSDAASVIEVPSAVLTLPDGGTLRAFATIFTSDGGLRTIELSISANTASGTIPDLPRGNTFVSIEFQFTDSSGNTLTVATATKGVDLSSGDAGISFVDSDYEMDSYDDDGDGVSNAVELAQGTDPTVPGVTGSPTGIWVGTLTENGISLAVVVIVQGDQIRLISEQDGTASVGTISVSGTTFTATTTLYTFGGGPIGVTSSITGDFTAGSAMSGSYTYSVGGSGSFSLSYSPDTDKGSSLDTVAGSWVSALLQFDIDNTGFLIGSLPCSYQGTVGIDDAAVNIYRVSMTTELFCFGLEGTYSGYAYVSDTSLQDDTLNVVLHKSDLLVFNQLSRF